MAVNPAAYGFPDAASTGVPDGVALKAYNGPMTITADGTVLDGLIINGPIRVLADNVTIKNCVVNFNSWWGIDAEGANNFTVEHSTIVGPGTSGDSTSAILGNGTFIGNDISKSENGIQLMGGASTVRGNYIHDLDDGGVDPHYDGVSVQGNQHGVLIENNTILGRDTSDVFIKNDFGPISDVTVNHNFLGGDPGYNVYVDGRASGGSITGVSITNNYVDEGFYGNYSIDNSSPKVSGNVEFDTSAGQAPPAPSGTPAPTPVPPVDNPSPGNPSENPPPAAEPGRDLLGGSRQDWLHGGAGDDRLVGNGGNDALFGGGGSDTFVYNRASDSKVGIGQRDLIHDFESGSDKIDLSGIDAVARYRGDQSFTFRGEGTFDGVASRAGQLKFHYETNNGAERTVVEGTTNNAPGVDFQISLVGHIDLTANDFIL